jgi:hypothetical protein
MTTADEDDLKEILNRPELEGWKVEALHDLGVRPPSACSMEANGYANIIMFIDCLPLEQRRELAHIVKQARVGVLFTEMHNKGLRPKWHEAIKAWEEKNRHE